MTTSAAARTIAIGDIHGCLLALNAILDAIDPQPDDVIVTLGDYVDRGPDSRGVLERLIALAGQCWLLPILGNHDDMLLQARYGHHPNAFLGMGGIATLASYGASSPPDVSKIPDEHIAFLETCVDYHETETHIFLHATYLSHLPMSQQPNLALRWESLRDCIPDPHHSGKTVIVGHTSQKSGEILDLGHVKCIDTRCYGGGWLTALDVHTGQVWQADRDGRLRSCT
jgi:serine/threonine protein phosphatase 1